MHMQYFKIFSHKFCVSFQSAQLISSSVFKLSSTRFRTRVSCSCKEL
jgi:hypothetical protein